MSRIRSIKPSYFRSRSLSRCSRDARMTFAGMWCEADDYGRGIADPRILKGAIWPLEDDLTWQDVEKHLGELEETGHIARYDVDGEDFFEVVNWIEHQSPAFRRGKGVHPARDGIVPTEPPSDSQDSARDGVQDARDGVLDGIGEDRKKDGSKERAADAATREFDAWWEKYPRKVNRRAALKAFTARRRDHVPLDDLTRARDNYAKSRRGEDSRFTLHGATFLGRDGPYSEWLAGNPDADAPEARNPLIPREMGKCATCGKLDVDCRCP